MSEQHQLVAIIDDEPCILRGLRRWLNACGFATEVFDSGEAFLQRDGADDVTCAVIDIHLGGISGIETRRILRARGSKIPVIFMTARDNATVRKEAMDTGCAAYLKKPFSGRELIDAIRNTMPVA